MNMIKYSESECVLIRAVAFIRLNMANGLYNMYMLLRHQELQM